MTRDLRGHGARSCSSSARACALIVIEPDLGTAMVTAFSVSALLIAAGAQAPPPGDDRRGARRPRPDRGR